MNQNTNGMTGKICSKCGKPIFTGQEDISSTAVQHLVCPQDNESQTPKTDDFNGAVEDIEAWLKGMEHFDDSKIFQGRVRFILELAKQSHSAQQEIAELKRLGEELVKCAEYGYNLATIQAVTNWQNHFKGKE